jgi:hypothetical protein
MLHAACSICCGKAYRPSFGWQTAATLPPINLVLCLLCLLWRSTQAIIYVVDSCDVDRLPTSREEFQAILEEEELKDAVILVYANKQVGGNLNPLIKYKYNPDSKACSSG